MARNTTLKEKYKPKPLGRKKYPSNKPEVEPTQEPSENPLAIRRNEKALKSILGRKPTLPVMRRRGWKRNDENNDSSSNENK